MLITDVINVPVRVLPHGEGLELPAYATRGASGVDLMAAVEAPVELGPGERMVVPTGLCLSIPKGYEGQVRPRSGLALKHGLTCLNTPGTIDSDYRGEIRVILINLGQERVRIEHGMRIAQLVFAPIARATWTPTTALDSSERGAGGFGHTGLR